MARGCSREGARVGMTWDRAGRNGRSARRAGARRARPARDADADAGADGRAPPAARSALSPRAQVVRDPSLPGGADVSLLAAALERLRDAGCTLETEASGNVTLETAAAIGATGVDFMSVGALTHSVAALDISLNVVLEED